jgi:hypothetical protein
VAACAAALFVSGLGVAGSAASSPATEQEDLVVETRDWVFHVPSWVSATRESVVAFATHVQNCTDLVRTWVGHRPRPGVKFVQRWVLTTGPQFSSAAADGVTHWVHADAIVPALPPACRGPHEVTHVLTSETLGGPPILVEGIAEFSDRLFTPFDELVCDDAGYTWSGRRYAYADLTAWQASIEHYNTAACLWYEIRARGGDAAIRRVLASARADRPTTTGDLLVRNVNPSLIADLTGIVLRYGFTRTDLTSAAPVRAPAPPSCPAGATADGEVSVATSAGGPLSGTGGRDHLCGGAGADLVSAGAGHDRVAGMGGDDRVLGGAGNDTLRGDAGSDFLAGGAGNDVLDAQDGSRDIVDGGSGKDVALVDDGDVVRRVERVRR